MGHRNGSFPSGGGNFDGLVAKRSKFLVRVQTISSLMLIESVKIS
ncbi:MAG: hypothetical protein CM1200mP3_07230 [Chloroflexota bacterium]|nr:MAG: hypothetical protein CM1200mP3_07230 [Chloroflexota bacterium]